MNTVCISHGEDVDGLICAAYLQYLKGASPVLATYDDFEDALKNIDSSVEDLYICDLGIREDLVEEILLHLDRDGWLVAAGHLTAESDALLQSFCSKGLQLAHQKNKNEWGCLIFKRESR